MKSIWNGTLGFGLVNIPIKMDSTDNLLPYLGIFVHTFKSLRS
ncbi:hypothetical protein J2X69_003420 [Algoriphagus sp. 4150]|nr:hypothetical protein [Algoriphagus sp. 4150]MDR7131061.1 hypothetical protein [Algoriphagus sp. 4150]